jgi:hypothetical protein
MPKNATAAAVILLDVIRDIAGIGAVASISYGAWLIYPPAGFVVGGVIVLVGVIASGFGKARGTGD